MAIDLAKLYKRSFNYIGTPYPVGSVAASSFIPNNSGGLNGVVLTPDQQKLVALSYESKKLFMPTKIRLSTFNNNEWYQLPNAPLISMISGSRKVIDTPIDSQDGTFKQYWGMDDYMVNIEGIAVDEENPDDYPSEIMYNLLKYFEANTSIEIQNELLTIMGINYLSVRKFDVPGEYGAECYQPYVISGKSDRNFELELKEAFK